MFIICVWCSGKLQRAAYGIYSWVLQENIKFFDAALGVPTFSRQPKKSLYVNKAGFPTLYSHKGSFYTQQRGRKLPRHHAHALALMLPRLNKVKHGDREIRIADFALPGSIHRQHIACQLVFRGLPPYQAHTWFAGSAKTAVLCRSSEQDAQLYRL